MIEFCLADQRQCFIGVLLLQKAADKTVINETSHTGARVKVVDLVEKFTGPLIPFFGCSHRRKRIRTITRIRSLRSIQTIFQLVFEAVSFSVIVHATID